MNFLERRAMQRAMRLLSIPIDEEVLDFDIAGPGISLLPAPFHPFGAKRIDLVCTSQAIYLHANGVSVRWEWDQFLELETVLVPPMGKMLKGCFVDGEAFYVPLGTSTRMLGTLVPQTFSRWFSELTPDQRMQRSHQLLVVKELKVKKKSREENLKPYRMAQPRAKGYAVERTTGEKIGHGSIVFMDDALWIHNVGGDQVLVVLPYRFLSDFVADLDDPSALRAQCSESSVREVVVKATEIEKWLEVFAIYRST